MHFAGRAKAAPLSPVQIFLSLIRLASLLLFVLVGTLSACLVDDEPTVVSGDLSVLVNDQRGTPVAGTRVYTDPISRIEAVTDAFGSATIKNVPVGTYDVFADQQGILAKGVVRVQPNNLTSLQIQLPFVAPGGGNPDGSPRLSVAAPLQSQSYLHDEAITFDASASDDETSGRDIVLRWVSNIDGLLDEGPADDNGRRTFVRTLSQGFHQMTVTATDAAGQTTTLLLGVNVAG